jgi:hypothetical protein
MTHGFDQVSKNNKSNQKKFQRQKFQLAEWLKG